MFFMWYNSFSVVSLGVVHIGMYADCLGLFCSGIGSSKSKNRRTWEEAFGKCSHWHSQGDWCISSKNGQLILIRNVVAGDDCLALMIWLSIWIDSVTVQYNLDFKGCHCLYPCLVNPFSPWGRQASNFSLRYQCWIKPLGLWELR